MRTYYISREVNHWNEDRNSYDTEFRTDTFQAADHEVTAEGYWLVLKDENGKAIAEFGRRAFDSWHFSEVAECQPD